jgi:methylenetetrahydrofolate reductase (NADPH)
MHIRDIFARTPTTFSFEFFPPKTPEGSENLYSTIRQLEAYKPSFVSVTYHPGGATRNLTHDLVLRIKQTTPLEAIPHLTCVCHTPEEIQAILERYADAGVSNILALGGDPPANLPAYDRSQDPFRYAGDLVAFVKKFNESGRHPDRRGFGIGVAGFPEGHPATPNRIREMDYLKAKVEAGADYICTQLFFDNHDFFDFRDRCEIAGIQVPIIAGIMPLTSLKNMERMAELAAGARFPAKLLKAINRCGNDEKAVERVGIHYATQQCADLLDHGVSGIHFYTLNRSTATREIYASLGLKDSQALRV